MKKILIIIAFLLLAALTLFAEAGKPILTVLDFETSEVSEAEMKSIIKILSSGLFKSGLFTVIDVAQRETVLKELEFSMSGCTDESCMLEVGKMLSAELIVGGSISQLGSKIVLSATIIETETSKTVSSADGIYLDMDDLLENIYIFRDQLTAPYRLSEAPVETKGAEATTMNPEQDAAPKEPLDLNIPAISTATGGVAFMGIGAYFLAVSLPLLIDYNNAYDAYTNAEDGADFDTLANTAETARVAADDAGAYTKFIVGASLAGGGLALGVVSTILFLKDDGTGEENETGPAVETAFIPLPGAATLSFRLRY